MTGSTKPRRRMLLQGIVAALALAAAIGIASYLRSSHFQGWVRDKLVAQLEEITGGRVELGSLSWNLDRLALSADNLTIHGLEAPTEAPYVHADRIVIRLKVLSWAGHQFGLRYFELDRPVIHLIIQPDGHTNVPAPRTHAAPSAVQQLLNLQVDRVELRDGVLIVNQRRMPLDLHADGFRAQMSYVAAAQRYDGSIGMDTVRTAFQQFRPFDSAVSAEFSVARNQLDLRQVRISSGNSSLEAAGQALDFSNPKLTLNYRGKLDVRQWGEITRVPQLQAGLVEISGSGVFTSKDFSATGKLIAHALEYREPGTRIAGLDGGAEFTINNDAFALPHLFARALGGTVVGSAEIKNWASTPAAAPAEQTGILRLRLQGLSLAGLAAAVSTRSLALDRLHPAGSVAGTVDVSWRGSPARAAAEFAVAANPPISAESAQLPITGNAEGAYSAAGGAWQLARLNVHAKSIAVDASGSTGARASNLRLALTIGDLRDLNALLSPTGKPLAQGVSGRASFTGILAGRMSAPVVNGHLTLGDFTIPVPLKSTAAGLRAAEPGSAPPARSLRFDSFVADVQYSPVMLAFNNGQLRRGSEQLAFTASTELLKGKFTPASHISARLQVREFSFADLQSLTGYDYPVSGVTNGWLQVSGPADNPRGRGHLRITRAEIQREPFQTIEADLVVADGEFHVNNLLLAHNGARVTGAAAYNPKTSAFRFNLQGANFNLAQLRDIQMARMPVSGMMSFDARGSGTRQAPVINADLHLRKLSLNGEMLGALDATASTTGAVMRVSARSNFPRSELQLEGSVEMKEDFPAKLSLRLAHLDIDPLLHDFLRGRLTGHSSLDGTVLLAGPLRDPRRLAATGDITQFSAEMEHLRIQNDGPLRFSIADQVLRLDEFRLLGDDTRMTATGTIGLAGARQLNLRGDGHVNLKLLQTWNPDLHSAGALEFGVNAAGTFERPSLRGQVKITNASLTHINFPNGLSDINGSLLFNQDRMQIQQLTASSGGGTLNFSGFVTYGNGLAFNLSASGKDVRLRYPTGISTGLRFDVRLTGTTANATLAGQATVTKFSMGPQFDLLLAVARSKQAPEPPNPNSRLNNLRLDLHVISTPELELQTSLAKVTGDVDVTVRGTATRPVLLGRINITEGRVTFNGTNYQVDRGDVSFTNPVRIEPVVDVEVTTRVQQYDITLGFHGPLDRMSTTYRSDPPLPTADIIALLAFGRTREESAMATEPNPSFSESASNAILGQALNAAVTSRVQRLFGASRIKIAPEVAGAETVDPNARVTIEQQVSKDFTVTYITDLSRSAQQIIQVEYNYSRNISVIASRDQYGVVAFDVRWRQRRK